MAELFGTGGPGRELAPLDRMLVQPAPRLHPLSARRRLSGPALRPLRVRAVIEYETSQHVRSFVAQSVLGIWLKTWDRWRASDKPRLRGAATMARARGIVVHDRILNERDLRIDNRAGPVPAERKYEKSH